VSPARIAACLDGDVRTCRGVDPSPRDGGKQAATLHRARLLCRAFEVIGARLAEQITILELCSIVGASRRCLETIFQEFLGMTPYQYVRRLRLENIREELLAAPNSGLSIGDIAARYGVWHLSRLASDYERLFGQLPSVSRRQADGGTKGDAPFLAGRCRTTNASWPT
jgi:AraC family ethanolamine operon transcriptional activator